MESDEFLNPKPPKERLNRLESLIESVYYRANGDPADISELPQLSQGLMGRASMRTFDLERIIPRYLNGKQAAARGRNFREIQRLVIGLKSEISNRRSEIESGGKIHQ